MRRRFLGVLLGAAVLASRAASGPAKAKPAPDVKLSAREALAVCGRGMTAVRLEAGTGCYHTAPDPMPPGHLHKSFAASGPVTPKCYGNGVNGPRVRLLYGYIQGKGNHAASVLPKIVKQWVPLMEGTFRKVSRDQGREIGVRFYAPECKLQVDVIEIPTSMGGPPSFDRQTADKRMTELWKFLHDEGYNQTDMKYLMWTDVIVSQGVCGVGLRALDDQPGPLNANNVHHSTPYFGTGVAQVAMVFGHCFGRGTTGALTETHELLHVLGAVQEGSPNSNGAGHCTDDLDIMCYTEKSIPTKRRCETPVHLLDCGMDDYFHAKPPVGSYLFTHWNTADSQYLGDAIGPDLIPVVLPRR